MAATWTCNLGGIGANGKALALPESLTVGTKLLLKCEGAPAGFSEASMNTLRIELPKEHKYELVLLRPQSVGDTGGDFLVTSWKAGQFKLDPVLTDGTHTVTLSPIELNVTTVIDQKTNPEGKPFPPSGPVTIAWPLWFWVMLAAVVVMALSCVAFAVFTYVQRRRFLGELEKNKPALTLYNQFNKELRKLIKGLPVTSSSWNKDASQAFFKDLETSLRWYFARELVIPVLGGASVAREIKKANRGIYDDFGKDIRLIFSEIEKALATKEGASLEDASQLAELTRTLTDRIHQRTDSARKGA